MSEATARRRLREPDVRNRLAELRHSTLASAADRLAALPLGAALMLGIVMDDDRVPASVRVRVAYAILSRVVPIRGAAVVEERLARVEAAIDAQEAARGQSRFRAV